MTIKQALKIQEQIEQQKIKILKRLIRINKEYDKLTRYYRSVL